MRFYEVLDYPVSRRGTKDQFVLLLWSTVESVVIVE